jgi:hypothetical protein
MASTPRASSLPLHDFLTEQVSHDIGLLLTKSPVQDERHMTDYEIHGMVSWLDEEENCE